MGGPIYIGRKMELKKLENVFYVENTHLVEVLDKVNGVWDNHKSRGYGIVVIDLNGLRFGIPLRSVIKHSDSFFTTAARNKGLDYRKSVLLVKDEYISVNPFKIPTDEHTRILEKKYSITQAFSKYVKHYVKGITNADANILKSYAYSTLQNYHKELGLPEKSPT